MATTIEMIQPGGLAHQVEGKILLLLKLLAQARDIFIQTSIRPRLISDDLTALSTFLRRSEE